MSHLYFLGYDTYEPLGERVYQETGINGTSGIFRHEVPQNNCPTPCHRKYSGKHTRCDILGSHDGKVGCYSYR